ncbi:MAG: hypothetical protein ACKOQ5_06450, partial [Solirubrobacterales bacterium]
MTEGTGEFELIDRLREKLGRSSLPIGPGDDAAVLPPSPGPVVTVDTSLEGIHFPDDWDDPAGIAYRAKEGARPHRPPGRSAGWSDRVSPAADRSVQT